MTLCHNRTQQIIFSDIFQHLFFSKILKNWQVREFFLSFSFDKKFWKIVFLENHTERWVRREIFRPDKRRILFLPFLLFTINSDFFRCTAAKSWKFNSYLYKFLNLIYYPKYLSLHILRFCLNFYSDFKNEMKMVYQQELTVTAVRNFSSLKFL